jgi:hypothetical protein
LHSVNFDSVEKFNLFSYLEKKNGFNGNIKIEFYFYFFKIIIVLDYNCMFGRVGHRTSCHTDPGGMISLNFLLSGKKRWYIIPNNKWEEFAQLLKIKSSNFNDFADKVPFAKIDPEFLLKHYSTLNLKIFNQNAGEIVIIPPNAFHLIEYTVK